MNISELKTAVDAANRILVITHVEPDGDALGSLTSMGLALQQLGKQTTLVCDNGMLNRFDFLPLAEQVQDRPGSSSDYDLIISLDCGDAQRMGNAYSSLAEPRPPLANIDHHITNTEFGTINIIDGEATSTCEMLYTILPALGVTWNRALATSTLTGIITDTLCFRTAGVTSKTLEAASALVHEGAVMSDITMQTINIKPFESLKLYNIGLQNMRLDKGLLWTSIRLTERQKAGYLGSGNSGLVSMLGNVAEAHMGAVLTELADGRTKANFRCRPPFNVAEVAFNLGGGGHALASGCTLDMPIDQAERMVVEVTKEAIERQSEYLED